MENNRWYKVTVRLWPDVAHYTLSAQLEAVTAMIPLIFLSPLAVIALLWLTMMTDWSGLLREWPFFVVITAVLFILNFYSFSLRLDFGDDKTALLSSSLAAMVIWGSVLIAGPSILWTAVLVNLIMTLNTARLMRVYSDNPTWGVLSLLVQEFGDGLFTTLIALAVYQTGGGQFPLTQLSAATWPALVTSTLVMILLPSVIMLLPLIEMNRLAGTADWRGNSLRFSGSMILLSLLSVPFGILIALELSVGGWGPFIFLLLGVILVNWLIYKFSQGLERQRRMNRELARMEQISQALLQSAPDASELETILAAHLPLLFASDRVQVRLFPSTMTDLPTFEFTHPPDALTATASQWEQLLQSSQSTLVLPDVTLPNDKGAYGDAIMVKIQTRGAEGERLEGNVLGGIYLIRYQLIGQATTSLPILQALAAQIGAALYRAQAYAEMLQNHKMSQEMAFAGQIQSTFLPRRIPTVKGWDMAAALIPARQTSGDFYDFVDLGHGRIAFVVADVSDKGAGAALYMALTRTLVRTYALQFPDTPARVLQATNERIFADSKSEQFVTLFYGVLDTNTGHLSYANAGHNPAFVRGSQTRTLGKTGIPLGMYEGVVWQEERIHLAAGDLFAAYTDGIPESENEGEEAFGEARLLALIGGDSDNGNHGRTADTIEATFQAVQTFTGSVPQFDDMTLLLIKRLSTAGYSSA